MFYLNFPLISPLHCGRGPAGYYICLPPDARDKFHPAFQDLYPQTAQDYHPATSPYLVQQIPLDPTSGANKQRIARVFPFSTDPTVTYYSYSIYPELIFDCANDFNKHQDEYVKGDVFLLFQQSWDGEQGPQLDLPRVTAGDRRVQDRAGDR